MQDYILKLIDINLSLFSLELDKNFIIMEILNMDNGDEVCTILINNIIDLKYKNNIDEHNILPAYIGELEISKNPETGYYYLKMQGWIDMTLTSSICSIKYPSSDNL
ncbi:hypothetical protein GA0061081_10248 [Gilliamella bombicola]|uniref:Uncharacterized protein n=1 Tax=Gilliamella bombicola TaxID=1798182 RepID=A0A1C3ZQ61_9GAMM|nr:MULTISPECIES: hypothetical protein [Gilliamella]NUF26955.1 hypothetical protein [Gilliamella sp. ESL0254]SCB84544.1 hypothetical protein GA0061081_10248 [Gilliamella bombicola]